jgi:predicted nucleotidyltransferase
MLINRVRDAGLAFDFEVIHLFEGGSKLHGARIEGKNDLDIYGVFIEPAEKALGLDPFEHFVTSTSDQQQRNTADDVDITLYSLRNWARLAAKGNPTALNFLFADNQYSGYRQVWNSNLPALREAILSRSAAGHYRGFVDGQMKRLLGQGIGRHGQRKELSQEFGYDTKAGMHALRLMGEGIELMTFGTITFPRPNVDELIEVRKGAWSLDKLCSRVSGLFSDLEYAEKTSSLRLKPDRQKVSAIIAGIYMGAYE